MVCSTTDFNLHGEIAAILLFHLCRLYLYVCYEGSPVPFQSIHFFTLFQHLCATLVRWPVWRYNGIRAIETPDKLPLVKPTFRSHLHERATPLRLLPAQSRTHGPAATVRAEFGAAAGAWTTSHYTSSARPETASCLCPLRRWHAVAARASPSNHSLSGSTGPPPPDLPRPCVRVSGRSRSRRNPEARLGAVLSPTARAGPHPHPRARQRRGFTRLRTASSSPPGRYAARHSSGPTADPIRRFRSASCEWAGRVRGSVVARPALRSGPLRRSRPFTPRNPPRNPARRSAQARPVGG